MSDPIEAKPAGILAPCDRIGCDQRALHRCTDPRYRWPSSLYLCNDHLVELRDLLGGARPSKAARRLKDRSSAGAPG